ncbi:MAG: 23S rRNA (uracil(1939)-C(5))-methyltransferase RlmD [Clostridiales Family XIII bacterium]|nr:23S rRNA (uracil(1939)-C(5))-methyltransferase RlmD [Clostridiales Family XIII bacterium]
METVGGLQEILITDMAESGEGIGRLESGAAVFVAGLVPGDLALVRVVSMKKRLAFAEAVAVLRFSEYRADAPCPYWGGMGVGASSGAEGTSPLGAGAAVGGSRRGCGGCGLMGVSQGAQMSLKARWLKERLARIGGVAGPAVMGGAPSDYRGCRGKAAFAVGADAGGAVKVGFRQAGSHEVEDVPCCLIQAPAAAVVADVLREALRVAAAQGRVPPVAGLTVRTGINTGEVMAVVEARDFKGMEATSRFLSRDGLPARMGERVNAAQGGRFSLESVFVGAADGRGVGAGIRVEEGGGPDPADSPARHVRIAGKGVIREKLGGLSFAISPQSFFQVNPSQAEVLAGQVRAYAALTGRETVMDLYCGVGALGLLLADGAKRVIGVEAVGGAVDNARANAKANGAANAEFVRGRAEEKLPEMAAAGLKADVAILDPPRAGCRPELLEATARMGPERIVYVSCHPATLARDVKILAGYGYAFVEARMADMFPHTMHVEAVALLRRQLF